jgi:mono/diheme cytochrome c family protein
MLRSVSIILAAIAGAACGRDGGTPQPAEASIVAEEEAPFEPDASAVALSQPPAPVFAPTPELNARRGRILFISNGCVICHQVNGVGGRAAPDLSAGTKPDLVDPLEFSARMWRGAQAMAALQTIELGYVIDLSAQNIADLAAFAASPEEQNLLTLDSVSNEMRGWFIDERYWTTGQWDKYRERGSKIPSVVVEEE